MDTFSRGFYRNEGGIDASIKESPFLDMEASA